MSITGISTTNLMQLGQTGASYFTQMKEAWQSLEKSLNSGDTKTAQATVATIQKLQEKYQSMFSSQDESKSTQFNADLKALSEALSKGDLGTAKTAVATLKNDYVTQREQFAGKIATAAAAAHSEALQELLGVAGANGQSDSLLDVLAKSDKKLDVMG